MSPFNRFFLFLFGTVEMSVSGDYCERFFNRLAANRIKFWQLSKTNHGFSVRIRQDDVLSVYRLRYGLHVKVHFGKRHGLPCRISKYRLRAGTAVGVLFFFIVLSICSGRIWIIRITGNENVPITAITECLTKLGVKEGVRGTSINTDVLKQELILSFPNLSWASLNIEGSVLTVNIREFELFSKDSEPSNIFAKSDGIVRKVDVSSGYTLVKAGDTVYRGQLLVSGITGESILSAVNSEGVIYAEVCDELSFSFSPFKTFKNETGKIENRLVVRFLGLDIPLFLGKKHGEYRIEQSAGYLRLFGGEVPVHLYRNTCHEIKVTNELFSRDTALAYAHERLDAKLSADGAIDARIDSETLTENNNGFDYRVSFAKTINIAKEEKFKIIGENS